MKRKMVYLIVFLVFLTVFFGCEQKPHQGFYARQKKIAAPMFPAQDYANILVTRAVDGDTLVLENGQRVRLIGIDTPEMHESAKLLRDSRRMQQDVETIKALGRRAYKFTRELVEGKRVRLEFDVQRYDKYNRLLAYVYLEDGTFVNAEIVRQGYASLMTYPPDVKYADLFLKLYQEARENNRGLWK